MRNTVKSAIGTTVQDMLESGLKSSFTKREINALGIEIKEVLITPIEINLVITEPVVFISLNFKVRPPSNKIIPMARLTKKNKLFPGNKPFSPFHIGCINLTPPSVYNVAKGPTKSPIKISGKIAGILNFHATHCANIPKMIIPNSDEK